VGCPFGKLDTTLVSFQSDEKRMIPRVIMQLTTDIADSDTSVLSSLEFSKPSGVLGNCRHIFIRSAFPKHVRTF
jgi:hypothetical protein